jgi:predicted nucleic acid-binding protein
MTYLLDVNSLLALGVINHEFHDHVASWLRAQKFPRLATCAITELGFVRVAAQSAAYGFTVLQAITLLLRLKSTHVSGIVFLADDHDISRLPNWVKSPKQTTDGHLVTLAAAHGAVLATLDAGIQGAYLIP